MANGNCNTIFSLRSGEIIHLEFNDARLKDNTKFTLSKLRGGHYNLEKNKFSRIVAITPMRQRNMFVSCTEDGQIKLWNIDDPKYSENLFVSNDLKIGLDDDELCCMDIDNNDYYLAIGTKRGHIYIFDLESKTRKKDIVTNEHISTHVTALKFSPNNDYLASGNSTGNLTIYITQDWELLKNVQAYTSAIFDNAAIYFIDWTVDLKYLQTETKNREYKFWSFDNIFINEVDVNNEYLHTKNWKTLTCLESWSTRGIIEWKYYSKQDETAKNLTSIDKTNKLPQSTVEEMVAIGYDDGYIELCKYPCIGNTKEVFKYRSHFGPMVDVKWSYDNKYLLTAGLFDSTINVLNVINTEK